MGTVRAQLVLSDELDREINNAAEESGIVPKFSVQIVKGK